MSDSSLEPSGPVDTEKTPVVAAQSPTPAQPRLARDLMGAGTLTLVVALGWWYLFYGRGAEDMGASPFELVQCLYTRSGGCGLLAGMAQLAGLTPYHPGVFWVGLALIVAGILVRLSAASERS